NYTLSSEIIPYLYFPEEGAGDGFQVGLARSLGKSKYKLQLTYGLNKYTYKLSREVGITVGGVEQFIKKADENIFTPAEDRVEGVPDLSKYEVLENAGFKHFKPHDGAYTTNYLTLEVLRKKELGKKWNLEYGLGGQIGLMNLNELAGAVVSELYYPLSGNYVTTNVTFRLSARYLYYGFTSRFTMSRKITDRFSVGVAGGIHMIMGKRSVDIIKPYLGILAQFEIN
ncbi:MAG: hypothetical protein AAB316_12800, partial [Bacteroidota bacterium]